MSDKKEYVKLWLSYEAYFQSYTPEEVGRLVLAMLRYKNTGEGCTPSISTSQPSVHTYSGANPSGAGPRT